MKSSLNGLIEKLSTIKYAEINPPCEATVLYPSANGLIHSGHAWTHELSELFLICNGFHYNGINLFTLHSAGTDNYYGLIEQNEQWNISKRIPGCVLFGRSDEEVYVYNSNLKKYQILDFTGWDEYYAFNTALELLEFVVNERL
ncbi:MAG: YrhA family protein [Lentimicrobium sp.]|jgi:hypothetical protein|nr:YrhA family protein [Lentimicrobium sp.]